MRKNEFIGIYLIRNQVNQKYYLGSSDEIYDRFSKHRNKLKDGKHHSFILQKAWDKYGKENFKLEIVELMLNATDFELREKEQWYLDNWECHYNVSTNAFYGLPSKEGKLSRADKLSKEYIVTSPDGKEFCIKNLTSFCKNRDLSRDGLRSVISGKQDNYKGWKARYINETKQRFNYKPIGRIWTITYPDGKEEKIRNLKEFCIKNNIHPANMAKVARGEICQTSGYKCRFEKDSQQKYVKKINHGSKVAEIYSKNFVITYPDGKTETIKNLNKFCRENNISDSALRHVASGRNSHHKGFKCQHA